MSIALLLMLLIGGCSGITPDGNMPDYREEGPDKGLFSGSAGEFILLGPVQGKVPAESEVQPVNSP